MKKLFIISLMTSFLALTYLSSEAIARTYSTNFPLTENPISEGGNWKNGKADGTNWQNVATTGGHAIGTMPYPGTYDDSTAIVTGTWGANQTAQATVYLPNGALNATAEVELRLRTTITPGSITGYEVVFSVQSGDTYHGLTRWNGPINNFTYLTCSGNSTISLHNGDVVKASIVGSTITTYINNVQYLTCTDSTYTSGSPGVGFWLGSSAANNSDFGFSDFTATDGINTSTPSPPTNVQVLP